MPNNYQRDPYLEFAKQSAKEVLSQEAQEERKKQAPSLRLRLPPKEHLENPRANVPEYFLPPKNVMQGAGWKTVTNHLKTGKRWIWSDGHLPSEDEWFWVNRADIVDDDVVEQLRLQLFKGFGDNFGNTRKVRLPEIPSEFWKRVTQENRIVQAKEFRNHRRQQLWSLIYPYGSIRRDVGGGGILYELSLLDAMMVFRLPEPDYREIRARQSGRGMSRSVYGTNKKLLGMVRKMERFMASNPNAIAKIAMDELFPPEISYALRNIHLIPDPARPVTWRTWVSDSPHQLAWNTLMVMAMEPAVFLETLGKLTVSYHQHRMKMEMEEFKTHQTLEFRRAIAEIEINKNVALAESSRIKINTKKEGIKISAEGKAKRRAIEKEMKDKEERALQLREQMERNEQLIEQLDRISNSE